MDWKETVKSMSDTVFPGISHTTETSLYGNEVMSNLPLQISLYFNVIFVPFWIVILTYKCFNELYKFIIIAIMFTVFLVEMLRLYLGNTGNLKDKIPELAGFWMLSLLIQLPLQGFLLFNPYFRLYVTEIVAQAIMFAMLVIELISGYWTLKNTAAQQAAYFRIMKLKSEVLDIRNKYKPE